MRQTNFHYRLQVAGEAQVVHRGVTQAARKMDKIARERYYHRHSVARQDVSCQGRQVSIAPSFLMAMKKKGLVVATCTQVWTAKRIKKASQKMAGQIQTRKSNCCRQAGTGSCIY